MHLDWSDGTTADVPAIWLRDNCPCDDCRVVATSERRKLIATEPLHLRPVSVQTDPSGVTVDWGSHVSHYSLDWYRAIQLDVQRNNAPTEHWGGEFTVPRFDYRALDESTDSGRLAVADFLSAFARYGIVIVGGVPTFRGESERFITRWAPLRELPFGRVHDVWVDPAGYNIAHTAEALPPHSDFPSYRWPPSGQILHMLVNDAEGGDSVAVDGWGVASRLDEEDQRVLAAFEVPFRQFDEQVETWAKVPMLTRDAAGVIRQIRFSNQLMQPLDPTEPELDRFYGAYHRLSNLVLDEGNQVHFRLDAGDMMIVHGHRILHGRRSYNPATGFRHLQDVYFEHDDLINRLHRLPGASR